MSHLSPAQPDSSHKLCYVPNFSSRIRGHSAHGRLRIQFDAENFLTWRNVWGSNVFFTRLEYRKLRGGVQHEFILLRGLSRGNGPSMSQSLGPEPGSTSLSSPSTSHPPWWKAGSISVSSPSTSPPPWWSATPDYLHDFVLKFERSANPHTQINALFKTEAFDYVDCREFSDLEDDDQNSTTELTITFPQKVAVEEVIKICASISQHQAARLYTLQQYNCFFYSWTIITILIRQLVDWVSALQSDTDRTVQLLTTRLVELSDPQRIRPQPGSYRSKPGTETRPNLALLIAGEYDRAGLRDTSQRPFVRLCINKIRESSSFQKALDSLQDSSRQPTLWIRDDLSIVRDHVRALLIEIADSMTEESGELTIDALFWGDNHIQGLSAEWKSLIAKEVNYLLGIYVNKLWENFSEALKQANKANQEKQPETLITRNRRSNALKRLGDSPLVLGILLTPVGLLAAWKVAQVRASLNAAEPPLLPLVTMMRTIRDVPNQIRNVSTIAGDFLAVLATKRDMARDEIHQARARGEQGRSNNTSLNLRRSTVLGMMDIDLRRPELEDQVVCELEKAIKNLALRLPDCTMNELRLATLEMLIRFKETAKSVSFGLRPESVWRIFLWYSLGEELVKVLEEAAEPGPMKRIHCWLRNSTSEGCGEEQPMLISDIHKFIHSRIKDLSEMIHNRGGPGAAKCCRDEIEGAMNTIWGAILNDNRRFENQAS